MAQAASEATITGYSTLNNEPNISREEELRSLYKRSEYFEWLLSRYRQYAREQLNINEQEFTTWLAFQTASEGIPDTTATSFQSINEAESKNDGDS